MRLHHREYGAGRPLLILHGLFGSSDNWHTIAGVLAARMRVIAVDLRNHGRSPHDREFSYPAMARDVAELIEELALEAPVVLGHSMGGKVAMELALVRPELVGALVVVDIAPKRYPPRHTELRDTMRSVDLSVLHSRRDAERLVSARIPDESARLLILKNLARDDSGRFFWRLDLEAISASFEEVWKPIDHARSYDGPALFVRGGRSDYVLDGDMDAIRRLFPRAYLVTIPEAGHWVNADRADELVAAVSEFAGGA